MNPYGNVRTPCPTDAGMECGGGVMGFAKDCMCEENLVFYDKRRKCGTTDEVGDWKRQDEATTTTTTTLPQLELQEQSTCSLAAWKDITQNQVVTRGSTSDTHVYVACPENVEEERKISCSEEECNGAAWCYVKAKCGGFRYGACKQKQVKALSCWGDMEKKVALLGDGDA